MSKTLRFRIISGLVAFLALVAAFLILNRSESSAVTQSTDDAYVQADFTVIVAQVAGVITRVDVNENQEVLAGAPLVGIDERDLRIAVSMAEAHINSAQATIASLQACKPRSTASKVPSPKHVQHLQPPTPVSSSPKSTATATPIWRAMVLAPCRPASKPTRNGAFNRLPVSAISPASNRPSNRRRSSKLNWKRRVLRCWEQKQRKPLQT